MGRKSREKHERRKQAENSDELLRGFAASSLYPLLDAASVSPTASHRGASIATLFHTTVRRGRPGTRAASAEDLPGLLRAVRTANPAVTTVEDFEPYDVRAEVVGRWGANLFRIVSGSLERPTAMVNQHARLADSIDRFLVSDLGFGLRDVGEIILRRLHEVTSALAPHWPDGPVPSSGGDAVVSDAEVLAAASLPSLGAIVESCGDVTRAQAAAASFVVSSLKLSCDPSHPVATFGSAIAVKVGPDTVWLPSGMLVEALPAIGAQLSAHAASMSEKANTAYTATISSHLGRLLQGSGHQVTGPIWVGSTSPIHSLITFNDRQVLALDVAAGLTPSAIQARLTDGGRTLAAVRPGADVRNPTTAWRMASDVQVVRLQVVAGPMHAQALRTSGPHMTVEDLEWILHSTQESPEDLWYFGRDLENPIGIGGMFAWDLIDRWEVWKPQSGFYRGGVPISSMMFSPHAAVAEWEHAANAAPVERALWRLGLPPLRDWPMAALDLERGVEVADVRTDRAYEIMPWSVPVAIAKVDPNGPAECSSTLWSLATGIAWKLEHSSNAFVVAATASGLSSLRIEFQFQDRGAGPPLTVEEAREGVLRIGWDDRLEMSLAEDSFAVETRCGQLVSEVFINEARSRFTEAWEESPPGIRIDGFSLPQRVQRLPAPLEVNAALRSDALRELGEHLAVEQVEPGLLTGSRATEFESRTVFPWLVKRFHESIAHLAADELLSFALRQLECSSHNRSMLDKRLSWERGFPAHGDGDAVGRRERISRSTRVVSFIVEEVLAHPPAGGVIVDRLSWTEALAIAELCIESCLRSDAIHFQLTRTAVEISDLYEVNIENSNDPTDVDFVAYSRLRADHMLPAAVAIATNQHLPEGTLEADSPRAMVELMPELAELDDCMRAGLGFGIDAITGVLNVATQFDASLDAPATATSAEAFVEECVDLAVGATREEFATALDWLTLRRTDLAQDVIPHWETERRAKRVATSPFVEHDDRLWVLPWTADSTLRIVANYLGDGRLPWPDTRLPNEVRAALDQYRQSRNREVEKDCVAALASRGFIVRGSVKPEKENHYGIANLTGEIDALCIDTVRSRIWVVEAKDPYTPYSARQVRRLINDFLASGKYVDRLLSKVADIATSAKSVAEALQIPSPGRPWTVRGLMVTRHLEPAAFAVQPRVAFCVLDHVADVVDQDELPGPGMNLGSISTKAE